MTINRRDFMRTVAAPPRQAHFPSLPALTTEPSRCCGNAGQFGHRAHHRRNDGESQLRPFFSAGFPGANGVRVGMSYNMTAQGGGEPAVYQADHIYRAVVPTPTRTTPTPVEEANTTTARWTDGCARRPTMFSRLAIMPQSKTCRFQFFALATTRRSTTTSRLSLGPTFLTRFPA